MSEPIITKCWTCQHFQGIEGLGERENGGLATDFRARCAAFPSGIPFDVYIWKREHVSPIEGQVGKFVFDVLDNPLGPSVVLPVTISSKL